MRTENLIEENSINEGIQKIYRFDNGYGASVVKHKFSYGYNQGLWELAVIKFGAARWNICYETPITGDVLGSLTDEEVDELLNKIEKLEAK